MTYVYTVELQLSKYHILTSKAQKKTTGKYKELYIFFFLYFKKKKKSSAELKA